LTWHGHQQQQKNKKNIFEPSLAQVVKILRSNLCQKLFKKLNLRCCWKLPCSKTNSTLHLTVESDDKAKCSWLAAYNDLTKPIALNKFSLTHFIASHFSCIQGNNWETINTLCWMW
jgi:hypothetical protein